MSFVVCNGAMCQCTFGVAPCSLIVTSNQKTLSGGMPIATIKDYQVANLPGFGMCQSLANPTVASATAAAMGVLTPQPCIPMISAPWVPGSLTVLVGGTPALNNSSKTMCNWAGVISITNPGQQTVQVP